MQYRYVPPTRRSILQEGTVKSFGPHHRLTSAGSVHAFQTRSRGASNMRASTSSRLFPLSAAFVAPLWFHVFLTWHVASSRSLMTWSVSLALPDAPPTGRIDPPRGRD